MTKHSILEIGDKVKCCGGMDGTVLAVSKERILIHVKTKYGHKYITGYNPHVTGDGVVWDWGHYHESWLSDPMGDAATLLAALKDFMGIHEEDE